MSEKNHFSSQFLAYMYWSDASGGFLNNLKPLSFPTMFKAEVFKGVQYAISLKYYCGPFQINRI